MPDPITHASVSFVIARHWFADRKGLFVLAALSPDLDVAIGGIFILLAGPFPTSVVDFTRASLLFHPSLSAAIWLWIIGSFATAFIFSLLAIALPMRFGEKRLSKRLI